MLSAPIRTAPAPSIRSIKAASRAAGGRSRLIFEPARVERPATSNRFFTAKGTPASGPAARPAATAASIALAFVRARSAVTSVNELRMVSCCLIRASAASVTSSADIFPLATARAISVADRASDRWDIPMSGCEDTGRLDVVRQREFIDHPRQSQGYVEVGADRRPPGVFDRDRQRLRDGVDIVVKRISSHCSPILLASLQATAGVFKDRLLSSDRNLRATLRRQSIIG